jgi:hypothetical protein
VMSANVPLLEWMANSVMPPASGDRVGGGKPFASLQRNNGVQVPLGPSVWRRGARINAGALEIVAESSGSPMLPVRELLAEISE